MQPSPPSDQTPATGMHPDPGAALTRLLGGADAPTAGDAEWSGRLAGCLDAFAAIELDGALKSLPAPARADGRRATRAQCAALRTRLAQVRAELADSLAGSAVQAAAMPRRDTKHDEKTGASGFDVWQQRHLWGQRLIDRRIEALRAEVARTLSTISPRLARLAALDAALDRTVGEGLRARWTKLAGMLERGFPGGASDPAGLDAFARRFHAAQLAELDLKLGSVLGMIEACEEEATR